MTEMTAENEDERYMLLAVAEACKAQGRTSPNPCVGAVVVKDGEIVGTGYHKKAGTPHAEVHALHAAGSKACGATIYVTLEPCCHTGKTPPCSEALVKAGVTRVVIGMLDPNPLVDGRGQKYLQDYGISVTTGVCEDLCKSINKPFVKYITTGMPTVTLKAGVSLDGRLSYQRRAPGKITGRQSQKKVHELRDSHDAILVGRHTVTSDNPSLTTRLEEGEGRDPARIVLDTNLNTPQNSKVYHVQSSAETFVFCGDHCENEKVHAFSAATGATVFPVSCGADGFMDLTAVCKMLAKQGLLTVLVEGGGMVHASFLRAKLVDQVCLFIAPLFAGSAGSPFLDGLEISSQDSAIRLKKPVYTLVGEDILVEGSLSQNSHEISFRMFSHRSCKSSTLEKVIRSETSSRSKA